MQIKNSYGFILFLLCLPTNGIGMEPVDPNEYSLVVDEDGLDPAEKTPLLDEDRLLRFDGSRRFFDEDARKQAKIKAYKQCLKFTALETCTCYAVFYLLSLAAAYSADALFEAGRHDQIPIIALIMAAASSLPCLFFCSYSEWSAKVRPATQDANPFDIYSDKGHVIPPSQELLASLNTTTKYSVRKNEVYSIRPIPTRSKIILFMRTCYELAPMTPYELARRYKLMQRIDARINQTPPLREEYRKVAYLIKKLLLEKLPAETVHNIFSYFPQNNILHHMLAHEPRMLWHEDFTYLTQEEIVLLCLHYRPSFWRLGGSVAALSDYYKASILAQNGWSSFSQSEKYPIRCSMRYFLPDDPYFITGIAGRGMPSPVIYLPYSQELAQCYRFEIDPAYTLEHQAPSTPKIERLLTLRQQLLERRRDNNL